MYWYNEAAHQGVPIAQMRLGLAYYAGEGVKRDRVEARKWLLLSADAGEPEAQAQLDETNALLSAAQAAAAQQAAERWSERRIERQKGF